MSKGFKITFWIMGILLFVMIMLSNLTPKSGLDIDTNLRENVPREEKSQIINEQIKYNSTIMILGIIIASISIIMLIIVKFD